VSKVDRRIFLKAAGFNLGGLWGVQRLAHALSAPENPQPLKIVCTEDRVDCVQSFTCTHQGSGDSCYGHQFWCQNFTCLQGPDFVCTMDFRCPDAGNSFRCSGTDAGSDDYQFTCSGKFSDYTDDIEGCTLNSQFYCDDFLCSGTYVR
jgi:hypothetical protein